MKRLKSGSKTDQKVGFLGFLLNSVNNSVKKVRLDAALGPGLGRVVSR